MTDLSSLPRLLRQWRRKTARSTGFPPELLDELQDHLLALVEEEIRSGHSTSRAWSEALARLGPPTALDNPTPPPAKTPAPGFPWARWGIAALSAALLAAVLLPDYPAFSPLLSFHVAAITTGYLAVFLAGAVAGLSLIQRLFRSSTLETFRRRVRKLSALSGAAALLTGLGFLTGALWAQAHWGRFFDWDPRETGGLLVCLWTLFTFLGLKTRRLGGHSAMSTTCAASALVAWSWFGANFVLAPNGLHAYGLSSSMVWAALIGFTLLQAALALSACLPAAALSPSKGAAPSS